MILNRIYDENTIESVLAEQVKRGKNVDIVCAELRPLGAQGSDGCARETQSRPVITVLWGTLQP